MSIECGMVTYAEALCACGCGLSHTVILIDWHDGGQAALFRQTGRSCHVRFWGSGLTPEEATEVGRWLSIKPNEERDAYRHRVVLFANETKTAKELLDAVRGPNLSFMEE